MTQSLPCRVHGDCDPTLVYLPGLHGDWTLLGPFRQALGNRARLVEFAYPRRTDWALENYARFAADALLSRGVNNIWVLGESFSSQVAWALVKQFSELQAPGTEPTLNLRGLILVGGFVKHPWPWGVWLAHRASAGAPHWLLKRACHAYGDFARRRHACSTSVCEELREFVERRLAPGDREAVTSRYHLIADNDLRPVARRATLPVFHLSGGIDPIVPWWHVRPWLRRHCPGFRESRILHRAGHNVLLDAPDASAAQILEWTRCIDGTAAPTEWKEARGPASAAATHGANAPARRRD
jgi:pimeloyl-ACP methyl ester carboxylesterase